MAKVLVRPGPSTRHRRHSQVKEAPRGNTLIYMAVAQPGHLSPTDIMPHRCQGLAIEYEALSS